jgi:hypothetical protein
MAEEQTESIVCDSSALNRANAMQRFYLSLAMRLTIR